MLFNSNLLNNFWEDVMDIANYLQTWLSTSYAIDKKTAIIPKEK